MKLNLKNNSPFGTRSIFLIACQVVQNLYHWGFLYSTGGTTRLSYKLWKSRLSDDEFRRGRLHKFPLNLNPIQD